MHSLFLEITLYIPAFRVQTPERHARYLVLCNCRSSGSFSGMLRAIAEFVLNTTYSTGSFLNVASRSVGVFVGAFLHRSNLVTSTSAAVSPADESDVFIGKRSAQFNVVTPTAEETPKCLRRCNLIRSSARASFSTISAVSSSDPSSTTIIVKLCQVCACIEAIASLM